MRPKLFGSFLLSLVIVVVGTGLYAEEEEEKGSVYAISTYKVRFDEMDAFFDIWENEWKPIAAQNDLILSRRVMKHLWGPDWTVIEITEYKDLASIQDAQKKGVELLKSKYPEKEKRDQIKKKFQSYIRSHTDAIVEDVPKLSK